MEREEYDLFGMDNVIRDIIDSVVKSVVKDGSWFSCCTKINDSQKDIMSVLNDKGEKLGSVIARTENPESGYRTAIYRYLLDNYLCYVEMPKKVRDRDSFVSRNTFDKFLATSNLYVVSEWLDMDILEVDRKYSSHFQGVIDDPEEDEYPYLKLYESKTHERKITKPRSWINLGARGIRVIPLFALKTGVDYVHEIALKDFITVTFMKDAGQLRDIETTFNISKIRDIYGDGNFYRDGIGSQYDGSFIENPNMGRGYIRVFEVGASRYDSPTRSINYARIISWKTIEKPDLSYIDIDLSEVQRQFISGVRDNPDEVSEIADMLMIMEVGTERKIAGRDLKTVSDVELWVSNQITLLSTVFLRSLALFMLATPHWFSHYTGAPEDTCIADSYNLSPEVSDSIEGFGLEFE